jgi:hypothetical protein
MIGQPDENGSQLTQERPPKFYGCPLAGLSHHLGHSFIRLDLHRGKT